MFNEDGCLVEISNKKEHFCDLIGFFSIGMLSLGYVVFGRPFAEAHIVLQLADGDASFGGFLR